MAKIVNRADPKSILKEMLDKLEELRSIYNMSIDELNEQNDNLCDTDHMLELDELTYHEQARLVRKRKEILEQRRIAKDNIALIEPLIRYFDIHKSFFNELRAVQGKINKKEEEFTKRTYHKRGNLDLDTIIRQGETEKR